MAENVPENRPQLVEHENTCVVCFKQALIFSIGSCSHAVCYECSSRMRVLCLQNECPICRQDLPKVIFTKNIASYTTLDREVRSGLYEKKYRIVFADLDIQQSFYRLLENRCPKCSHHPFSEFAKLKEHVRKSHELFYCEICTDNLKVFARERRCYSRAELANHRKTGDANDSSHKGHPRCEYCELRYLDKDELFRHLRREHFFCHLCDADGVNLFYGTYPEMRNHFKAEHFLCEEAECADEQFTAVFRSEIDLKAHKATVHSKTMTKSAVRQTRTLDLEFSYEPRGRGGNTQENPRGGGRHRYNDPQREFDRIPEQTIIQQPPAQIDTKNEEHFPSLGGGAASGQSVPQLSNTVRHIVYGSSGLARTKENFPALGGFGQPPIKNLPPSNKQSKMPSASSLLKGPSGTASKQSKNIHSNKSSSASFNALKKDSIDDFPALGKGSGSGPLPTKAPVLINRQMSSTSTSSSVKSAATKKPTLDFPALSQNTSKKNRTKAILMEDMIESTPNANVNFVPSKHRALVDDYVSMASTVSKVQLVQQKDVSTSVEDKNKKVPKLNSANNFPTLGSGSEVSAPPAQWLTSKPVNIQKPPVKQEMKETPKKNKKIYELPQQVKTDHKMVNGNVTTTKTIDKERKEPNNNNNKENKNGNFIEQKDFPKMTSADTLPMAKPSLPPGFTANEIPTKKLPPGFNNFSLSTNENEFPNLLNEHLGTSTSIYSFLPPPQATKRNLALVAEFQKSFTSPESMQQFKEMSNMFRDGNYFASSYYDTCKVVLGSRFDEVFPELLALLPDIEKQQSLYEAHLQALKTSYESSGVKPKKKGNIAKYDLEVCATCKQVLRSSDLVAHVQSHALENNFPSLNDAEPTSIKNWKK